MAVDRGLLMKLDRGHWIIACKCVPRGVVRLETAPRFYEMLRSNSDMIWMAIRRKARKLTAKGLPSGCWITEGSLSNCIIRNEPAKIDRTDDLLG
jgi:hypothetical protein